nr:hypothetical protein [Tanacetum cinerariifolium]
MIEGMRQTLGDRLRIVYTRDEGHGLFTSHAWRRLFEIRAPLVWEFILEFLGSCRISDTKMGLNVADTLCFQLGGVRHMMTWRQFIFKLGLHTDEEMTESGFGAYWLGTPSYVFIRDPVRRLCCRMISCSIFGKGQEPVKVTGVDLFYLRKVDWWIANVPYLLAQYLFRHADGRKSRAIVSGGHFIGSFAVHFKLVSNQRLRGLLVVTRNLSLIDLYELRRLNICVRVGDTWAWVAPGPESQSDATASTPGATKDALVVDEGAQANLAHVQEPQPPPPALRTMKQRIARL